MEVNQLTYKLQEHMKKHDFQPFKVGIYFCPLWESWSVQMRNFHSKEYFFLGIPFFFLEIMLKLSLPVVFALISFVFKNVIPTVVQLPIFMSMFFALRGMARNPVGIAR